MKKKILEALEIIAVLIIGPIVITSAPAIILGLVIGTTGKGCEYRSIISLHPAYVITCELAKDRW